MYVQQCFWSHCWLHRVHLHVNTDTYMLACLHTYIHTYMHTYIHTYSHWHSCITDSDIQKNKCFNGVSTYIHTYLHAHLYFAYMATYLHTTHIHIHICLFMHVCIYIYKHMYMQTTFNVDFSYYWLNLEVWETVWEIYIKFYYKSMGLKKTTVVVESLSTNTTRCTVPENTSLLKKTTFT